MPILAIADGEDNARMIRGLEIGVNDYLMRPIDKNELLARVRTQIRKKRYTERLRDNVQQSIEMAITDGLTGLLQPPLHGKPSGSLVEQAAARGKPLTVLVLDIDYFKSINDSHGHDAGDDVLREFAIRIRKSIRGIDLACRLRRRGVRDRDAGDRHGGRDHRRRAAAPAHRVGAVPDRAGRAARSTSRSRSASPRSTPPTTTPQPSSSAPTRRSIAPSATAATGSSPTRREFFALFAEFVGIRARRARVNHNRLG